jgi:phosphatidylinositol alpha-1,6-mannosyltransferase
MPLIKTGILGLLPCFEPEMVGGIQVSGRLAWDALVDKFGDQDDEVCLFSFGGQRGQNNRGPRRSRFYARSKIEAIAHAVKWNWRVRLVFVWHLGLLKLLPFFRIQDAPVALFLHGIEAWGTKRWFDQSLLRRVNLFLSNSEHTWERFLQANPAFSHASHQTVHLGMSSPLNRQIQPSSGISAALMVARLSKKEHYKGHSEMIKAWPLVLQRMSNAQLWVAGNGDLLPQLQKLVFQRRLESRVCFFGSVSETRKKQLLAKCRCMALPSRGEGFGLAYVEAMRMGRPCLVSTVDAGREVVNPPEAGLAVDPASSGDIADRVCQLLSLDSRWYNWSLQAQARYEERFTAKHFQERLISALESLNQKPNPA